MLKIKVSERDNSYQKGLRMNGTVRSEKPGLEETGRQRRGKGWVRKLGVLLRG